MTSTSYDCRNDITWDSLSPQSTSNTWASPVGLDNPTVNFTQHNVNIRAAGFW